MRITRHLTVSIDYVLSIPDRKLKRIYPDYTPEEVRKELQERKAAGERLLPSEGCEGFCPVNGCPGHPKQ